MMKFNRKEIIKALEICSDETKEFCTGCPFIGNGGCKQSSILKLALSVIKELTEDNKRLNKSLEKELLDSARVYDNYCRMIVAIRKEVDEIKAGTVQKMQEKILAKSEYGTINISPWQLDQIAKEMLEENK